MTADEFRAGMLAGTCKASALFEHFKRGDFTPADYDAAIKAAAAPAWQQREEAFYQGGLFKAQRCLFNEWRDGLDLKHDRRRAEEYLNLEKSTGCRNAEIQLFIRLMVSPRRGPVDEKDKDPVVEAAINTKWISNIDKHQWRHWPKKKDLEQFQLAPIKPAAFSPR